MAKALHSGWFDATFPGACDMSSALMLDPKNLAAVAAFRMATGDWSQGVKLLTRGLAAGYPDAGAYSQSYTTYVEHALARHRECLVAGQGAGVWEDRLKELFVLQAANVRYLTAKLAGCCVL